MINALEADKQTYQYLQALCKAAFSDLDELIRDAIKSGEFQKIVKKRSVAPAEMEKVVLKASDLSQIQGDIEWEVKVC